MYVVDSTFRMSISLASAGFRNARKSLTQGLSGQVNNIVDEMEALMKINDRLFERVVCSAHSFRLLKF
jgi:hypothetical protein